MDDLLDPRSCSVVFPSSLFPFPDAHRKPACHILKECTEAHGLHSMTDSLLSCLNDLVSHDWPGALSVDYACLCGFSPAWHTGWDLSIVSPWLPSTALWDMLKGKDNKQTN